MQIMDEVNVENNSTVTMPAEADGSEAAQAALGSPQTSGGTQIRARVVDD